MSHHPKKNGPLSPFFKKQPDASAPAAPASRMATSPPADPKEVATTPPALPEPLDRLARADVKPMTIDPAKLAPETFLLAKAEAQEVRLQHLENGQAEIRSILGEIRRTLDSINEKHSAMGWKVSGALASALGALIAAVAGFVLKH